MGVARCAQMAVRNVKPYGLEAFGASNLVSVLSNMLLQGAAMLHAQALIGMQPAVARLQGGLEGATRLALCPRAFTSPGLANLCCLTHTCGPHAWCPC